MMKQARELQGKMEQLQTELETLEVQGSAGGGMVNVTMTGKGEMTKVAIDPSLMKEDEREILEDLIVAASADAKGKAERAAQEKMKELTGGLQLPPGLGL
ncbi:MAG: YbaB/EbfC family nucleoid-associated protein [Parvibaculum sp.]|nr:YbaB/EbfC family nucleoid-associated protein [Parvibaculum sp.]